MTNIIHEYTDAKGSSPYAEWLGKLRDAKAKARIMLQVDRMELGLFGKRTQDSLWPGIPGVLCQGGQTLISNTMCRYKIHPG